jgi:hypothetical protein
MDRVCLCAITNFTQLGLFYGMPLLGPALGPLIGGALGNVRAGLTKSSSEPADSCLLSHLAGEVLFTSWPHLPVQSSACSSSSRTHGVKR